MGRRAHGVRAVARANAQIHDEEKSLKKLIRTDSFEKQVIMFFTGKTRWGFFLLDITGLSLARQTKMPIAGLQR
jgi:hypothetical protein